MELKEREEVDMEGTPQPTVHVVPSKPQDDKKNVGITVVIGAVLLYILVPDKVVAAVQMLATLPLEQVGAAVLYLGLGALRQPRQSLSPRSCGSASPGRCWQGACATLAVLHGRPPVFFW